MAKQAGSGQIQDTPREDRREDLRILLLLAAAVLVMYLTGIGCPIRFLTGIPCAGCGMSRALLELARGHLTEALQYHPLCVLMPAGLLLWLFRRSLPQKLLQGICAGAVLLFLVVYIFRILRQDPVLEIDLSRGLIARIIQEVRYVLSSLRQ